jgi:rare lipoprotein A
MSARLFRTALVAGLLSMLAACAGFGGAKGGGGSYPVVTDPAPIVSGTMRPYQIRGRWYRPAEQPDYDERGTASWYGAQFNGRPTASGERFDMNALTAAHKTLPLPGLVEVTNLSNGRQIVARVNDRGPFVDGRIIDLSRGSAEALGLLNQGVGEVRVRYLGPAPRSGGGTTLQYAERRPEPRTERAPTPTPASAPAPVRASGPVDYLPGEPVSAATTETAYAAPAYSAPSAMAAGQWVQAGSWNNEAEARRAARHLGGGASATSDGAGGWRVLVGPWPDAATAERSRRAVVSRGYADALLISGG